MPRGASPKREREYEKNWNRTQEELAHKLKYFSRGEIKRLENYEKHHQNRQLLLKEFDRALQSQ